MSEFLPHKYFRPIDYSDKDPSEKLRRDSLHKYPRNDERGEKAVTVEQAVANIRKQILHNELDGDADSALNEALHSITLVEARGNSGATNKYVSELAKKISADKQLGKIMALESFISKEEIKNWQPNNNIYRLDKAAELSDSFANSFQEKLIRDFPNQVAGNNYLEKLEQLKGAYLKLKGIKVVENACRIRVKDSEAFSKGKAWGREWADGYEIRTSQEIGSFQKEQIRSISHGKSTLNSEERKRYLDSQASWAAGMACTDPTDAKLVVNGNKVHFRLDPKSELLVNEALGWFNNFSRKRFHLLSKDAPKSLDQAIARTNNLFSKEAGDYDRKDAEVLAQDFNRRAKENGWLPQVEAVAKFHLTSATQPPINEANNFLNDGTLDNPVSRLTPSDGDAFANILNNTSMDGPEIGPVIVQKKRTNH